jgi:AAA family ATP:ADP antiporter
MFKTLMFDIFFKKKSTHEILRLITLGISIFLVMGAYTIFKELKDSIFMITVGSNYLPDVKTLSLLIMIPMVLFYGWLSQRINRGNLLICCLLFYGFGGIIATFFIQHQTIGLYNTVASKYRLFGWIYYLFLEGCSPFLVSAMWSFFNSISHPKDIKNSYIKMTVMSKLGGIIFSSSAFIYNTYFFYNTIDCEVKQYCMIMFLASIAVLFVPIFILLLLFNSTDEELKGYSDNIIIENQIEHQEVKNNFKGKTFGLGSLLKNKYILGIFGMTFFWEVINVIFNNLRLNIAFSEATSLCGITAILYKNILFMHIFGLFFVLLGTKNIIKYFGEKIALILIPITTGLAILVFLLYPTTNMIFVTYLIIRAINYTLAFPIREALFIPTTKNIQFKTKSWIDSFGQKFSKGCGSIYNKSIQFYSQYNSYYIQIGFFAVLILLWTIMSYNLGKKWEKIIKNKEIIS